MDSLGAQSTIQVQCDTQFEFLYAREKTKKTWLLFPGDACTRDTSAKGLDLPGDPAHPDPAAYQRGDYACP